MSTQQIPPAKIAKGTILGFISWGQKRGNPAEIKKSLEIGATVNKGPIFDIQGNLIGSDNTPIGKVKIDASSPKCKNGVCTQGFKIFGLTPALIQVGTTPPGILEISVKGAALNGALETEVKTVKLKPTEGTTVKLTLE